MFEQIAYSLQVLFPVKHSFISNQKLVKQSFALYILANSIIIYFAMLLIANSKQNLLETTLNDYIEKKKTERYGP